MKKNVLLLTLLAFFMCNTAFAQVFTLNPKGHKSDNIALAKVKAANYVKWGLCANEFDENYGLGVTDATVELHAMAKLSASFVSPFAGAQIVGINAGFCEAVNNVTVFIRETPTGANIASKLLPVTSKGWNQVVFDSLLVLEKKDYYIGYQIPVLPQATHAIGCTAETAAEQEAIMFRIDDGDFVDYTSLFGALAVQLLLSGSDDIFQNKAEIIEVEIERTQPLNAVVDIPIKFRNIGTNDITGIEITYALGSNEAVQQSFSVNVPARSAEQIVTLNDVTINMNGDLTVAITKVNGVEFSGNSFTAPIRTYDPATTALRKVLLEQFTTEKCGQCPSGSARIKNVIEQADFANQVIWVAHHAGYFTDKYTISESKSYLRFYGEGTGTFAPAMMLDRTIFAGNNVPVMGIGDETQIANSFRQALEVPTTISLTITQANTVDVNRKVKITVVGNEKNAILPTEDLYAYILLLENEIKSTTQSNSGGSYIHNNVIRKVINGVGGTKITWDENNSFSVTAETTLTPGWNAKNIDVVAFIAKNYQNALNNVKVINAEKKKLVINSFTAVDNVYNEAIHVYAENGVIVIDGEYTSINIYSIDGKEIKNNNLPKGIYIVKLENKGQNVVKKVIVR